MFCKKCGNEIKVGANFCKFCGIKIEREETESNSEESIQICKKCKTELKNNALFCNRCETSVNEPFQDKTYNFRQYTLTENIMETIKGREIRFQLTDNMLVIIQEVKYQNKITVIPYNKIKSFELKNKINFVSFLLAPLCWACGLWCLSLAEEALLVTLALFLIGILCILILPFYATFCINLSYGKKMFFNLKRINQKQLETKEMFVNDLNARINNTETLLNITEKESKIKTGYTKVKISEIAQDLIDKFLG